MHIGSVDKIRLYKSFQHYFPLKEAMEGNLAKDTFGGRLTPDFITERLGHANFQEIRELDFPQASIRTVDLGNWESFINLRR